MSFKNNIICEEFSKEMWKYLDGSLSEEVRAFWDKHLSSCTSCTAALNEVEKSLSIYESLPLEDISDKKFDLMVEKAVGKSRFISRLYSLFDFRMKMPLSFSYLFSRFSLSSAALAAAAIIIFIIFKPKSEMKVLPGNGSNVNRTEFSTGTKANSGAETTSSADNLGQAEADTKTTEAAPVIRTRQEVMEWKAVGVKNGINEVGYSLDLINASKERRNKYSDKWTLKAAALGHEIERLEKEINSSSL